MSDLSEDLLGDEDLDELGRPHTPQPSDGPPPDPTQPATWRCEGCGEYDPPDMHDGGHMRARPGDHPEDETVGEMCGPVTRLHPSHKLEPALAAGNYRVVPTATPSDSPTLTDVQSDEELAQFLIGRADVGRNAEASRRYRLAAARIRKIATVRADTVETIAVMFEGFTWGHATPEECASILRGWVRDRLSRREGE